MIPGGRRTILVSTCPIELYPEASDFLLDSSSPLGTSWIPIHAEKGQA